MVHEIPQYPHVDWVEMTWIIQVLKKKKKKDKKEGQRERKEGGKKKSKTEKKKGGTEETWRIGHMEEHIRTLVQDKCVFLN